MVSFTARPSSQTAGSNETLAASGLKASTHYIISINNTVNGVLTNITHLYVTTNSSGTFSIPTPVTSAYLVNNTNTQIKCNLFTSTGTYLAQAIFTALPSTSQSSLTLSAYSGLPSDVISYSLTGAPPLTALKLNFFNSAGTFLTILDSFTTDSSGAHSGKFTTPNEPAGTGYYMHAHDSTTSIDYGSVTFTINSSSPPKPTTLNLTLSSS
jgi:hypothetical protein